MKTLNQMSADRHPPFSSSSTEIFQARIEIYSLVAYDDCLPVTTNDGRLHIFKVSEGPLAIAVVHSVILSAFIDIFNGFVYCRSFTPAHRKMY